MRSETLMSSVFKIETGPKEKSAAANILNGGLSVPDFMVILVALAL